MDTTSGNSGLPGPSAKGYFYVPHHERAPNDIDLNIDPQNILNYPRRRRANLIVEEPLSLSDPTSYKDVRRRPDAADWIAAKDVELSNIVRHGVWEVAEMEAGKRALDTIYVYQSKKDTDRTVVKKKAWLCVLGNCQVEGINYNKTFAPTGRDTSL